MKAAAQGALVALVAWNDGPALHGHRNDARAAGAGRPISGVSAVLSRPLAERPYSPRCPSNMQLIEVPSPLHGDRGGSTHAQDRSSAQPPADRDYCIDRYEASTEELRSDGTWQAHSPYRSVRGIRVRAVSRPGVIPQGYISRDEAEAACVEAGKRLCTDEEWVHACRGAASTRYPYGNERRPNVCVDTDRVSPLERLFGQDPNRYRPEPMNDPRLNQVPGTVAPTGSFAGCTNGFRVYDMVGNVHEWTSDPSGTFRGGYYLDTKINGEGCSYRTVVHGPHYHDYSTGFRCCADPALANDRPGR